MVYSVEELVKMANKKKVKYVFFWGHKTTLDHVTKACFSQWFPSKFQDGHGNTYLSAEHYMMVKKAELFGDAVMSAKTLECSIPAKAKAYGRQVRGFDQAVWDRHKFDIVVDGNLLKFSQDNDMKEFLLSTQGRVLVEASPVDRIWGIGLAVDHEYAENPNLWRGENLLGFALMKVRDQLLAA